VVSLVMRLCRSELPQARSSAAFLVSTPYPHVQVATKAQLRQLFQKLCTDDEIMVRRSACVALGKSFAKVLGPQALELMPSFASFVRDGCDGVRLQAIPTAIALVPLLPESGVVQLVSFIKNLSTDPAWRVRFMVADKIAELSKVLPPADASKVLLPVFKSLCQDGEAEIRASVVFNMHHILAACTEAGSRKDVLATGTRLVADGNTHVRVSLASSILRSSTTGGKEFWQSHITPCCLKLVQDPEADVRLALLTGFSAVSSTSPEAREIAPKLIPSVLSLAADPKWRIREMVVGQIPAMVTSLGKSADEMVEVVMKVLTDRVASIRTSAAEACRRLAEELGAQWVRQVLVPRLPSFASGESVLKRITFLSVVCAILNAQTIDAATFQSSLWSMVSPLTSDRVANVRLHVARTLVTARLLGKGFPAVDVALSKLSSDDDADVRNAATQTTLQSKRKD